VRSTQPLVSVVIPTYNRGHVVGRAIRSALKQSYRPIEILVVDDGSTDDTRDVVSKFEERNIHYVRHPNRRNGAAARNTGVRRSRGQYVAFLDSDDEWLPSKLQKQVAALSALPKGYAAVYCRFLVGSGKVMGCEYRGQFTYEVLAGHAQPGSSSLLVRRDALERIQGFDECFQRFQDLEFMASLMRHYKIELVDEPLYIRHLSGSPPAAAVMDAVPKLWRKFAPEIEALGAVRKRKVMSYGYLRAAELLFKERRITTGFLFLCRSIFQMPTVLPKRFPQYVAALRRYWD
jgi:glycosyltransferase involved in cell wall biosynthesis